jgi:hypothetical protein
MPRGGGCCSSTCRSESPSRSPPWPFCPAPRAGQAAGAVLLAAFAFELLALAWIRRWFFGTGFLSSFVSVTIGGVAIATISAALGAVR